MLAALAMQVGCGPEAPDGVEQASEVGSISLALVGTSVTGATYRLSNAWFDIYGPTNRLVYGSTETPVITEVLPVGGYDVYLEQYWVLERWTGASYQPVQAVLTSPNPLQVFINEGTTSTVVFQFRADGDIISVGQGSLDIVIGVDDTAAPREVTDAACSNGYDDDGDGLADCADPECQWLSWCVPWREDTDAACSNGYDDDGDGLADCADPECQWLSWCVPWREDTDAACSNGYDDDGDGLADCADPECQWMPVCAPWGEDTDATCSNGYDDDGDGLADCADPGCQWLSWCAPWGEDTDAACSNGYDDDGDGLADCADPGCQWLSWCAPWGEDTDAACSNGYDDDGDGLADCADPDCQWLPFCAPPSISAQFTDTLGDDIPDMWPAAVLADATDADDIVLECRECADCATLRWSLASVGFSPEQISEITYYSTAKEEVVGGEEDIMQWPAGCVDCFGTSCYPRYNFLYWRAGSGLAHFHLTETADDCSISVWNVMGPRDTDGSEGNLCRSGVVGGASQQPNKVGEWFQISIVNPR
ncbi:hypothetical protein [Sorangium sp. So ce1151]|uniref:hypothetical protein n=1 Tax=Sorangium sp. So ce1151 TaxID=3133332 RepID=UPI003F5F0D55